MYFGNLENIDSDLFIISKELTLKLSVNVGKVSMNDSTKLSPMYEKTYNSKKYSNYNQLKTLNINSNHYLNLSYFKKLEDKTFKSESVYMSYPHLPSFIKMLKTVYKVYKEGLNKSSNKPFITTDNGVIFNEEEYKEIIFSIKDLIGGKSLTMYYDMVDVFDSNGELKDVVPGIVMLINDIDNNVSISMKTLESLINLLDGFNLYNASQTLLMMGMLNIISENNNGSNNENQKRTSNGVGTIKDASSLPRRSATLNKRSMSIGNNSKPEVEVFDESDIENLLDEIDNEIISSNNNLPKPSKKELPKVKQEEPIKFEGLNDNLEDIMAHLDDELDFDPEKGV